MCTQALTVLLAILIQVESPKNEAQALAAIEREGAYGCLQIRELCLQDVNEWARTQFTLQEVAGSEPLSRWVFVQYQQRYKSTGVEQAARLWNGGPSRRGTNGYWRKVRQLLEKQDTPIGGCCEKQCLAYE